MGVQGVKFHHSKSTISQKIVEWEGRISRIAKDLGYSYRCIRDQINSDDDLKNLIKETREYKDESLLEDCEDTLKVAVNNHQDMSNALKAVTYILERKGKNIGYNPINSNLTEEVKKTMSDVIQQALEGNLSQE